ncbi:MAG TPA: hypothetical protein VHO84_01465, partial [Syntrophorhabdaceae bacterium]|nr:hypothetical protein [Syntrophorhabdaceae bacterium]
MSSNRISLNPTSMLRLLGGIALLLLVANIAGLVIFYMTPFTGLYSVSWFFIFDNEQNVPTFFSALLLLIASSILAIITTIERRRNASQVVYWAFLSIGFLLMGFDELFCLHERLMKPMNRLLGSDNLGFFHFSWVIPAMFLIAVLAGFYTKFVFSLHSKTRFTFRTAGIIYIGGCIGFELVGGKCAELHGGLSLSYNISAIVEELMEMAGVIL